MAFSPRSPLNRSSAASTTRSMFASRPFTNEPDIQPRSRFAPRPFKTETDAEKPETDSLTETQPDRAPIRPGFNLAAMPLYASVQAKLTVGEPGDKYEQEADRTAAEVMQMPAPALPVQQKALSDDEEAVQTKPIAISSVNSASLQQKCSECEQEQVQRSGNGTAEAGSDIESRLSSSKGGGSPLSDEVRSFMEPRFGADFSQVRTHTGGAAVQMSQAIGAQAFTHGNNIYFGAGKSPANSDLTAHELTHVVQQTGAVQAKPAKSSDINYGTLLGAGDEAEAEAAKAPLTIDTAAVTMDMSRVDEIIGEIDKNQPIIKEAETNNKDLIGTYQASVTNTTTKANLQILKDKLAVTNVDTSSFAVQFRTAYADYQRLLAEGTEYLSATGVDTNNPIETLTSGFDAMGKDSLKLDAAQVGLQRFRAARTNLNTSALKMDGEMKGFRGAAQSLQAGLYSVKSKAAAKQGADANSKLVAVRSEIDEMAKSVGTAIKVASALDGFVGTGGAVGKTIGDANAAGESAAKLSILKSVGKDVDSISAGVIPSGDPAKIAEELVKFIGEQVNKDKIVSLQQTIASAAAEGETFNAAAEASTFAGLQSNMEAAAAKLSLLVTTYQQAKAEMSAAGEELMAQLEKSGGKKGKDQSKSVLFLTDADRFLAQVTVAITNGTNQQSNVKDAANDRKKLRGTTNTVEAEPDRQTQKYWKATKTQAPGKLWGTNDLFRLQSVDVTFTGGGNGFDYNDIVQGGQGTVEGNGGAEGSVAKKLETLTKAKTQIQELQKKVQAALGIGEPGINA